MADRSRSLIGTRRGWGISQRVYRTQDYLEVEDVEGYDVRLSRVFYDEIMLVTCHRFLAWLSLITGGLGTVCFGCAVALIIVFHGPKSAALGSVIAMLLSIAACVLYGTYRVEAVTVYGRRTRACMHFWMRSGKAREAYDLVCRLALAKQTRPTRQERKDESPTSIDTTK
jgi:hypothetical protein